MKIGLEVHIELNTKTKLFCSCKRTSGEPNTRTCPICLGHPGSKPKVNREALVKAVKLAKALKCQISDEIIFSRKSYFYPDLAKNYQITQYENPLGKGGVMGEVSITRVHVEEDPASLVHPSGITNSNYVLVDYNRSGNPLCEVVTGPDISSPAQAREFMKSLVTLLKYLGIYDPDSLIKADANISIAPDYVRTEIKNITGFKEIERALEYEAARQKKEGAVQETRLWDPAKGITLPLRKKEDEEDYGYIYDPDLVPIETEAIGEIVLPILPSEKVEEYLKLGVKKPGIIASDYELSKFFDSVKDVDAALAEKWVVRELLRVANYNDIPVETIDKEQFRELLKLLSQKMITDKTGQEIMEMLAEGKIDVKTHVEKNGLLIMKDTEGLEKICRAAIENNPKAANDYKEGNENSLNYLVGQVMRETKGTASPHEVRKILKKLF